MSSPLDPPRRALAIGAHPDDVEFGAGATLARWADAGTEVSIVVLTDGSKGSWDADDDLQGLIERRALEQRAAADVLGAGRLEMAGFVDGELTAGHSEQQFLTAALRRLRPDVVLGHDPWKRYRLHPDHRQAGFATVDAIVAARDPHFFTEQLGAAGLTPHRPEVLLLFEADEANHTEPAAGTLDRKVAALLEHRSQWLSTMGIAPGDETDGIEAFGSRVRAEAGDPPVERFHRIGDL